MLRQYDDLSVFPVFSSGTLYFLQQGVYDSLDEMREKMGSFSYYIYNKEDDGFHTYVGITASLENSVKIKDYFNSKGYDIYVDENTISNDVFFSVVSQYDLLLFDAQGDSIADICNQVLNSYEELVINENEDEGSSKE